ncbi:hypothetical protein CJU89_4899 [Yarrowia sp. B02]|nr:hypothetical protein CJU89_4899 [Yarrowia sp. B02]
MVVLEIPRLTAKFPIYLFSEVPDRFNPIDTITSCHIDKVGIFHLYRYTDNHYVLTLKNSSVTHFNNWLFGCGSAIERFIPLNDYSLLLRFYDYPQQVLLVTQDKWKTFKDVRIDRPRVFVLTIKSLHHRVADTKADAFIRCHRGPRLPVHSEVVSPKWPFFAAELKKSSLVTLKHSTRSVEALLQVFYGGRQLNLEKAVDVLLLAIKYDLPEVVSYAVKCLYAVDICPGEAINIWREVREHNRAAALLCIARFKRIVSTETCENWFGLFLKTASDEEMKAFQRDLSPKVAIPRGFRDSRLYRADD